ncbi:methylamine methyltransferase corrinoid protein reductive activase [Methanocella sp. MCL-LM]|uniref:methylamine methyltransferase corrinoid protein reductive activase n=1 Tax=Methanocella sp. MCL-LM TaxID=3412035 RepID=UPI003C73AC23
MARLAIAMDLGTSGFRAQAINPGTSDTLSTVLTTGHPLPGNNVIDHIQFALEAGGEIARGIIMGAVNRIILALRVPADDVGVLSVCGNPAQLSLFQGMEIRDLAYAGKRKLDSLGVAIPGREAAILKAKQFPGLNLPPDCDVIIPPAVRHEVGADALALILKTGMLELEETSLAIDYGTNAEMALFHDGLVYTGSTAAGPALEGQQITCGTLATPGAICDLQRAESPEAPFYRLTILDSDMSPVPGPVVDFRESRYLDSGMPRPSGITGTGVVAAICEGIQSGLITIPHIATTDRRLHLGEDLFLSEEDLTEAGKAIGSVRAGYIAMCKRAGIAIQDIDTVYMSGSAGTYIDALKAQKLGLIPPRVSKVCQVGNTSLAMARDLASDPAKLDTMSGLARKLKRNHCMFAHSVVFKKVYLLELSYWTEGMPARLYRSMLNRYGLPDLPPVAGTPEVLHLVKKDIDNTGALGLVTLAEGGPS